MNIMTVPVSVAVYVLLPVLEDAEADVAGLAKVRVLADAKAAVQAVQGVVPVAVILAVQEVVPADAVALVLAPVLLVLMGATVIAAAVVTRCVKVAVQDAQEGAPVPVKAHAKDNVKDVLGRVTEVVALLAKAVAEEVAQEDASEVVRTAYFVIMREDSIDIHNYLEDKMITINIEECESNYIEKLWYDYNALLNLITYMAKNDVAVEEMEYYKNQLQSSYMALEVGKQKIAKKYIDFPYTTYTFNFDNMTLDVERA